MQPNIQPPESYTHAAFIEACENRDLVKVNSLIAGSTKEVINKQDENGRNALHTATRMGMVETIITLIEKVIFPFQDNKKKTPRDLAMENGNQEAQEILKQYELDLELQTCSIRNDHIKIKKLLQEKANPYFKNKWSEERNAFHLATMKGNVQSMDTLIEHGIDVNIVDKNGYSALHLATSRNEVNAVKLILNTKKADLDLANKYGYTPILTAIENGHIEILQSLLDANASLDVKNKKGETAYKIAERSDNTQIFSRVNLNANQLAILKKQADAIAISKKTEEGKSKVRAWLERIEKPEILNNKQVNGREPS